MPEVKNVAEAAGSVFPVLEKTMRETNSTGPVRSATRSLGTALAGAALAVSGISFAAASPYTAYFEGITTYYLDRTTGTTVPANEGQPFYGWISFDVTHATSVSDVADSSTHLVNATSSRGCLQTVNGLCVSDNGAQMPVVTGYFVSTPFAPAGGYQAIPDSAYLAEGAAGSYRQNWRVYPSTSYPAGLDTYVIRREQYQYQITGDTNGTYTIEFLDQSLDLLLYSYSTLMLGSISDLTAPPNLAAGVQGTVSQQGRPYHQECTMVSGIPNCGPEISSTDAHYWSGTLTSFRLEAGNASAAFEPGTAALLCAGLSALAASRRRKQIQ